MHEQSRPRTAGRPGTARIRRTSEDTTKANPVPVAKSQLDDSTTADVDIFLVRYKKELSF
eukprot:m.3358 g.3358  ORF g.3358 m.3358 type:complete len:60 (+) comp2754_c0_seq2:40-219(+)